MILGKRFRLWLPPFGGGIAVIASHCGFTDLPSSRWPDKELDFIINYDIKYRMGGADDGEED